MSFPFDYARSRRALVASIRLKLQHDLAGAIMFEPFVGDGRPSDIAAELLQFQTLIGAPQLV